MKFKNLFLFAAIAILASCGKYEFDATQVSKEVAAQNARNQLGVEIDPNQDWKPIHQGSITITANADLENIVKVQVLTESPFSNEDALVLNSKDCTAGQQVTLSYEAPDYLTELVAACVNNKGVYYIKVFDINATTVDFKSASARTRADDPYSGYPSQIILGSAIKSFNAERAEASLNSESKPKSVAINEKPDCTGNNKLYTVWNDGSWLKDRLWSHQTVAGDGEWKIEDGTIVRPVSDAGDLETVRAYVDAHITKKGGDKQVNGKTNNWVGIAQGNAYFEVDNNYLTSNGTPVVLIPLEMNTTEGHYNTIYYYYYDPTKVTTAEEIKKLPKFKAIKGFKGDGTDVNKTFNRKKEYLLPYYGDSPIEGMWASPVIPKGYKIGFLNRKDYNDKGMSSCASGCTYGDGRLNVEVNHLVGHYFSAIDKSLKGPAANGMAWDSPRIGVFSANNRTYLCFEDGADLNFRDMIIEVKQGTEIIEETVAPDVEAINYTMCFEDRPETADYDMNDVVLTAKRESPTEIKLTLAACGAKDKVVIQGVTGKGADAFNGHEIHDLLGLTDENPFANTQIGGNTSDGFSETITVDAGTTIVEFLSSIYIENYTTHKTVKMAAKGGEPYVIIVPMRFNYPKEGTSIKKAYPEFLNWAQNAGANKDWYRTEGVDRFPTLFLE